MLQYLINTSIIWLACLVLYELLLRKESFHQYNRAYLLTSLAIGLLLPMANLNSIIPANTTVLRQPTQQVYEIKKAVFVSETPATPLSPAASVEPPTPVTQASPSWTVSQLLWTIYLLGVAIGLIVVMREAYQLMRLYASGSKRFERKCKVVETGKVHCPFSFFNIVFVGRRQDYDQPQWNILLDHETEHGRQLHSLDNIALILLRIVFWFHPLPHVYYRRLMLVHEFQADEAAANTPADYGSFLLEQSLLRGAPVLTHSFNYSPIKNRIAMLTGTKSTRTRLLKYLSVIPLSVLLILFCTQVSFSGGSSSSKWNRAYFKGNEIEFGTYKVYPWEYVENVMKKQKDAFLYTPLPDTIPVMDWKTGLTVMRPVPLDTTPVAINGKPIFGEELKYEAAKGRSVYLPPVFKGKEIDPVKYLFSKLESEFRKLDNGVYYLDLRKLVIDDNGDLAYYQSNGVVADRGSGGRAFSFISDDLKNKIDKQLFQLLEGSVKFRPALNLDGVPINARLELPLYEIQVKGNQVELVQQRGGC